MRESHEQLRITEAEWAAFCKNFEDTVARFGVPDAEKNELYDIVTG
jgi:truncated hemoglobin YjbI